MMNGKILKKPECNGKNTIITQAVEHLLQNDPYLIPYEKIIHRRLLKIVEAESRLTQKQTSLADFASGHEYFGIHFRNNEWVFREWAPNATAIYLIGDFNDWQEKSSFSLERIDPGGVWEIRLSANTLSHGDLFRLRIHWHGGAGNRIPTYARRVLQDPNTLIFNAQVWCPPAPYRWEHPDFRCSADPPLIYEAHVGMAQDEEKVGTYDEFSHKVLPRVVRTGYNTLQLMAIQEHPYYGSFGYHISNFFAASSRFGTPHELKRLIDTAHSHGLRVIMDIIHSHAVSNEVEGLSRFDGTLYQFFHEGPRGRHEAWDSRCFDYGKYQVLHFLLSNCRYWLDEYHVDGFRFDGITSMLYLHHGLGKAFTSYDDYFDDSVDEDALTYLALANKVIHEVRPDAITVAEDVSGMPGLAVPWRGGGIGFDYRFAMGVPDYWIRLTKETRDEDWHMGHLWYELTNRRQDEKIISYAESHDQAIVGDQTLIFRLMGSAMYDHMRIDDDNLAVDRGMALIKMIRLVTVTTAGDGYLNFMGNEFGHPDWIDFPRKGNEWSFKYAQRRWDLVDDPALKYHFLAKFDRDMIALVDTYGLLQTTGPNLIYEHIDDQVIVFKRSELLFIFNFHSTCSHVDYTIEAPSGKYRMIFDTDAVKYGGHGRLDSNQYHVTSAEKEEARMRHFLRLYLPTRTAIVLESV
jgi:1,4-alpha-glucan branching enzyme